MYLHAFGKKGFVCLMPIKYLYCFVYYALAKLYDAHFRLQQKEYILCVACLPPHTSPCKSDSTFRP